MNRVTKIVLGVGVLGLVLIVASLVGVALRDDDEPEPTAVARATPTAPPLTADENEYLDRVADITEEVGDLLEDSRALLGDPRLDDPLWRDGITIYSAGLVIVADDAATLDQPSERFEYIHRTFGNAMEKLREASILLSDGVQTSSANAVSRASDLMLEADRLMRDAATAVGRMPAR